MSEQHLWLIHGNLQTPAVWDDFKGLEQDNFCLHKLNLWETKSKDFWSWAQALTEHIQHQATRTNCSHHLIGYSLGGRLALHALYSNPELWASATIIAADTGLTNELTKARQLDWDSKWAKKFLTEEWGLLLSEWSGLSVFCGREAKHRLADGEVARAKIANLFLTFSKGKQDNLLPMLSNTTLPPTLYVTGEEDTKYCKKGQALAVSCDNLSHTIIPNAAHRVPWENPEAFESLVLEHIQSNSR